jgi:hypothetical protein
LDPLSFDRGKGPAGLARGKHRVPGARRIRPVLRLVSFFLLAVLLASVLGRVPVIGPLFAHTGLLGVLLASFLLSAAFTRLGAALVSGRKLRGELERLAAVDSAHNHGKLGSLYLAHGRPRRAIEALEQAVAGEPAVAEWHYRLGLARLATGDAASACAALERATAIDEEHAYGAAQLGLARARARQGRHEDALAALAVFERNHGPSPESAFRRARSLARLGRRAEARRAHEEVARLAARATRYQKREAVGWALRSALVRWF